MRITKMHPKKKETHIVKKKTKNAEAELASKGIQRALWWWITLLEFVMKLPRNRAVTCDLVYH